MITVSTAILPFLSLRPDKSVDAAPLSSTPAAVLVVVAVALARSSARRWLGWVRDVA